MTNEQINKNIAQVCGWKLGHWATWSYASSFECKSGGIWSDLKATAPDGEIHASVPDYCNDLNAMHEAETVLTPIQQSRYAELLGDWPTFEKGEYPTFRFLHSPARQRAEAFLRTLGKWE